MWKIRAIVIAVLVVGALFLSGCVGDDQRVEEAVRENARLRQQIDRMRRVMEDRADDPEEALAAQDQLLRELDEVKSGLVSHEAEQTKSRDLWGMFAKQMAVAVDRVDPAVLKTLFDEGVGMDQANARLAMLVADEAAEGVIYLDGESLRLRMTGRRGAFGFRVRLQSGTTPAALVVQDEIVPEPPKPPNFTFTYDLAQRRVEDIYYPPSPEQGEYPPKSVNLNWDSFMAMVNGIDKAYRDGLSPKLDRYLRSKPAGRSGPAHLEWPLYEQLGRSGRHELQVAVDPQSDDWDVTFELVKVTAAGVETPLNTLRLNATLSTSPPHEGSLAFRVRPPDGAYTLVKR